MRSNKGRGTTVKVSLPLRPLVSTPSAKSRAGSLDLTSQSVSVGFFGFGSIERDPATEPNIAKANKRLLGSMKRYCMQLGLPIHAADDNLSSNATVYVISEQALKRLSRSNDRDLRGSLLSADSLRKPLIVICATRDSALKLRYDPWGSSLPSHTQYLWLPIGPAKLSGALSACRTYREAIPVAITSRKCKANMLLVGALREGNSDVAVADGAPRVPHDAVEVRGACAKPPSFRDISLNLDDEERGNGKLNPILPSGVSVNGSMLSVPQSPRPLRSGSETLANSTAASLPLRAQMVRASTEPSVSTKPFSILLVDDNASNSPKLLDPSPANTTNRLSICASSKCLPRKADTSIAQRRTAKRL